MVREECKTVPYLKLNKFVLKENIQQEIFEHIKSKVNDQNVATYYQLAKVFYFHLTYNATLNAT